jgi:hypothetical protein
MWKIAAFVLLIIFLVADSMYIYRRLKKYWRNASWQGSGQKNNRWKLGLSSLDIPLNKQTGKNTSQPEKK